MKDGAPRTTTCPRAHRAWVGRPLTVAVQNKWPVEGEGRLGPQFFGRWDGTQAPPFCPPDLTLRGLGRQPLPAAPGGPAPPAAGARDFLGRRAAAGTLDPRLRVSGARDSAPPPGHRAGQRLREPALRDRLPGCPSGTSLQPGRRNGGPPRHTFVTGPRVRQGPGDRARLCGGSESPSQLQAAVGSLTALPPPPAG